MSQQSMYRINSHTSRSTLVHHLASAIALLLVFASVAHPQTGGTGALSGTVTDPAGAVVPAAQVKVTNADTGEARVVQSSANGTFLIPLLPPGVYRVEVTKSGFKLVAYPDIRVVVTETTALNVKLEVGAVSEQVTVEAGAEQLQTESSALGRVTSSEMVVELPLVARNFTQIIGLNAGVAAGVTNAADLGRGNGGTTSAPFVSQGGTGTDNNFQMDGLTANDIQNSGQFSGGAAIPNPDTIQEFKVQTGMYDASYGRNAGANVNVVTKGGTNQFHGSLWEFLRNEDLNANSFFANQAGQPRQILRQNQYGLTAGGPVVKDRLLMFGSYQGTDQLNGVSSSCSSNFRTPPLTNDRSRAALGALFAGQRGYAQGLAGGVGPAIAADGSNISPQALALLNMKFANGQYVIPTPQRIDSSQPFASQGVFAVSLPCTYSENQYMINGDYYQSDRSKIAARFFSASSEQDTTLPGTNIGGPTAPGWPVLNPQKFINASLTHTFTFSPNVLNELQLGYHRQDSVSLQSEPINFSDFGSSVPSYDNNIPAIDINGALTLGGNGQTVDVIQNTYVLQDSLSWNRGRHALRFGGGLTKTQDAFEHFHYIAGLIFLAFPDFLLGLNAQQLGTAAAGVPIGNVYESVDLQGQFDRDWRIWESNLYLQDDYKVNRRLTLNLGLRFERLGNIADSLGRGANFFYSQANSNPPASGTLQGFVVPANFQGPLPTGVTKLSGNSGFLDEGQNTWNPRIGFAWQLPRTDRFVLRGGYGMYHSRTTGQVLLQLVTAPPFSYFNVLAGASNATASWATPFPAPVSLPSFPAYSPTTRIGFTVVAPDFRPPTVHRINLGLQTKLRGDMVLEVGYVGARDLHLVRGRSVNQAALASPSAPIRGVTTNTIANVGLRVPYEGFTANTLRVLETNAAAWYNSLNVSLVKRYSYGLHFQASYTWSRFLATDTGLSSGSTGGSAVGDQNSPSQRYGPDSFNRDHRFVLSAIYSLPSPFPRTSLLGEAFGGWQIANVATVQSGQHLTVTYSNSTSVYGTTSDRAQLVAGCTAGQLLTTGAIDQRTARYINTSCFTTPPVIGDDGKALGFGNSGVGILTGPGQVNFDFSLIKQFPMKLINDQSRLEFRTEFFNTFNHPNFGNPTLEYTSATFGRILSTTVNPRVIQFALKFAF